MEKYKCNNCQSTRYYIKGSSTISDERYGIIRVELRECLDCFRRYRVAITENGTEFDYK